MRPQVGHHVGELSDHLAERLAPAALALGVLLQPPLPQVNHVRVVFKPGTDAVLPRLDEAFRVAQIDASTDFNYTPMVAAALLYLAVTIPLARLLERWGYTEAAT